ncbi:MULTISPECIES: hypothetical protein [unclassified Rathayibacter]|uniref:hypothetical protein n=1 Tax=unclassified Rathayibacter TaxID=2609250 RepID=UPI000CE84F9E|nr:MULTISPECIES: hypothetical protein [unclassified Rathayibacter]PPF13182.1 hypothetical protein C5B98_01975 [Rathayibacter sp. AY1A5]PPH19269.1 hypothetical protein C5C35_00700 [Rathayibacter sp. AY1F8]
MRIPIVYWYFPLPEPLAWPQNDVIPLPVPDGGVAVSASIRVISERWPSVLESRIGRLFESVRALQPPPAGQGHPSMSIPVEPIDEITTVVEMLVELEDGSDPTFGVVSDAFDIGIRGVRALQQAYVVATQHPIDLVSRQLLPSILPMTTRLITASDDGWPGGPGIFLPNDIGIGALAEPTPLTERQSAAFRYAYLHPDLAYAGYTDLRREAAAAMRLRGDVRSSVIHAATAAEVLIDTTVLHLLWEVGRTPEEAAPVLNPPIAARVRSQFPPLLGGVWACRDITTAPGAWLVNTANLRNRVVHSYFEPSVEQANAAYSATIELEQYICDLLCKPRGRQRFPRTALALAGNPGLLRRGVEQGEIELMRSPEQEPGWVVAFAAWREEVMTVRQDPFNATG